MIYDVRTALRANTNNCQHVPRVHDSNGESMNPIETIDELSPMQQAMLFHSLYAPGSGVYVLPSPG